MNTQQGLIPVCMGPLSLDQTVEVLRTREVGKNPFSRSVRRSIEGVGSLLELWIPTGDFLYSYEARIDDLLDRRSMLGATAIGARVEMVKFSPVHELRAEGSASLLGWVKDNWVYPPGSLEMFLHIQVKTNEELNELVDSMTGGSSAEVIGELGDICWLTVAQCLNEVDSQSNVKYIEDMLEVSLGQLAKGDYLFDALTLGLAEGIDRRQILGRIMNCDRDLQIELMRTMVGQLTSSARKYRSYIRDPRLANIEDGPRTFCDAWNEVHLERMLSSADGVLALTHVIAVQYGSSLTEVLEIVRQKQEDRVRAGMRVSKFANR